VRLTKMTDVRYFSVMPRPSSRDDILDTGVQMASVWGLAGLSIGKLAAAVGMTKGGICAHFPAKSDLQLAVVERAAAIFREEVVDPALEVPAGLARVEVLTDRWFDSIEAQVFQGGCFFTNAALELDDLDQPEVLGQIRGLYRSYLGLVEQSVGEAVARGELASGTDPRQIAVLLHGLEVGALVRHALGETDAYPVARSAARSLLETHRP